MLLHLAAQQGALLGAQLRRNDCARRARSPLLALLDRAAQFHQPVRTQLRLGLDLGLGPSLGQGLGRGRGLGLGLNLGCKDGGHRREEEQKKLHACN